MEIKENIVKEVHPHPLSFLGFYFSAILFIVLGFFFYKIVILLGIFVFLIGEITRRSETFYILEGGVARSYNFLSTSRKFIEFDKIQNLSVSQSFIENIFGIGSIKFDTAGTDKIELNFYSVKNPYDFEKKIRDKMVAS